MPLSPAARPVARASSRLLAAMAVRTAVATAVGTAVGAQDAPPAAPPGDSIPVRRLAPAEARATQGVNSATMVRALSDGSVYVNDTQGRRILRFGPRLDVAEVIADTMPNARIPYGQRPLGMLPYAGDSTLLVDPATLSLVLLDPAGRQVRVMAPPRTGDINTLASSNLGANAFDPKGRLVYRAQAGGGPFGGGGGAMMMFGMGGGGRDGGRDGGRGGQGGGQGGQGGAPRREAQAGAPAVAGPPTGGPPGGFGGGQGGGPGGGPGGRGFNPANQPDSVPILRADFDTRTADTVTFVKMPRTDIAMTQTPEGGMRMTAKLNPLPQGDDWAMLSDGTVAVVRVLDYHVDYYAPDGTHTAGPRLPFDWKRISDDDKVRMIDSLRTVPTAATERARQMTSGGGPGGRGFNAAFEPIEPEKLPDYYPPIRQGTSMADRDGHIWTLPSTSSLAGQLAAQFAQMAGRGGGPGGGMGAMFGGGGAAGRAGGDSTRRAGGPPAGMPPAAMGLMAGMAGAMMGPFVYDVISRSGGLVERVQLPPGRQLVGFGPDGAIYLAARQGREMILERTRRAAP